MDDMDLYDEIYVKILELTKGLLLIDIINVNNCLDIVVVVKGIRPVSKILKYLRKRKDIDFKVKVTGWTAEDNNYSLEILVTEK